MKKIGVFRLAIQLFGRYLVGSIIALLLDLSVMMFLNNPLGRALCQLLCFSAAFSLVYLRAWQVGNSDKNMIEFGHITEDGAKGFKSGLLAAILPIIPSVVLIFSKLTGSFDGFLYIYRFLNPIFMPMNYSLLPATLSLGEIGILPIIISGVMPLIFIILSGFGYTLGLRDMTVSKALGIAKKKAKPE